MGMLSYETTIQVTLSIAARVAFFALCRTWVQQTLLSDLQQVIVEEDLTDEDAVAAGIRSPRRSPLPSNAHHTRKRPPNKSALIFCLAFSESCVLCSIVVLESILEERTRWLNWTASICILLLIIYVAVPLGQCWMFTRRPLQDHLQWRTIALTAALFTGYEVVLQQVGSWLSSVLDVEAGSHRFGLVNTSLERICAPGVLLIAALSGAGAVNTAWNAYEWREKLQGAPITESTISITESAMQKAKDDLQTRQRELESLRSSRGDEARSFLTQMFVSDPGAKEIEMLSREISSLRALEKEMRRDLAIMHSRRRTVELSGTLMGKLLSALGWAFTAYCCVRVCTTAISLLFGLDKPSNASSPTNVGAATQVLNTIASALGFDTDFTTYSHLVSLGLTGTIILANMRTVLVAVSRVLRVTTAGSSASFMMLFLSQLMAVYLLTSLISLPDSGDSGTHELLRLLPDFRIFRRLFDGAFFIAAVGWAVARFLERKIRADDTRFAHPGIV